MARYMLDPNIPFKPMQILNDSDGGWVAAEVGPIGEGGDELARMAAERDPGRCYSYTEIAEACGCDSETVRKIEGAALLKLRRRLKRSGFELGELEGFARG